MYDLSILIPAKSEEWVAHTVEDIIKNKRGKTEVIVGLDGEWANPGIMAHPDVRIVHVSESLGQRGMTNFICKLSTAKYVAKTDAHCNFDEGFDVKLMEEMQDDYTMVPVMRNLHVFNWRCKQCGDDSQYQGPAPEGCAKCNVNTPDEFEKVLVWRAKPSPNSSAYKFTPDRLQFKYFGSLKRQQDQSGETLVDTMSLQGSFFMLTRKKYWELNICDESWGGWGQQGTEVALKTWLSGGRVVCNKKTWYAHMFRTKGDFAFPWGNPGRQQQQARAKSWELFAENKWEQQVRPLSWVVEKFWEPLQQEPEKPDDPKWTAEDLARIKATEGRFSGEPSKGMIFYTTNKLQLKLAKKVQQNLTNISNKLAIPIVSASLKPMDFGKNIHLDREPGWETYFHQIIAALENSTADIIYFCEHDVIYAPEHFDFTPKSKDKFYYNQNWWRLYPDGSTNRWDANQVSGLVCYRQLALDFYKQRLEEINEKGFDRSYEPGGRDPSKYEVWHSERPNIDLRFGGTLTKDKKSLADFRDKSTSKNWQEGTVDNLPGWNKEQFGDIIQS